MIDTSSWQQLFGCYRRERFPTLWHQFGELVSGGSITSIKHVLREIESQFLREIYAVPRFSHVVPAEIRDDDSDEEQDEDPDADADPFLIARANAIDGMVITQERMRGNRVRIPSICRHFDIKCGTLDDLMERENWSF